MTKWQTEIASIGMVEVGEFWRDTDCDGCGANRAVLLMDMWQGYEDGPRPRELCAQCLRDLATDLDAFEVQPNDED